MKTDASLALTMNDLGKRARKASAALAKAGPQARTKALQAMERRRVSEATAAVAAHRAAGLAAVQSGKGAPGGR